MESAGFHKCFLKADNVLSNIRIKLTKTQKVVVFFISRT